MQELADSTTAAMNQRRAVKAAHAPARIYGNVQCTSRDRKVQMDTKRANPTRPLLKREALIHSPEEVCVKWRERSAEISLAERNR